MDTLPSTAASRRSTLSMPVFVPAMLIIAALLAVCTLAPRAAEAFFAAGQAWVTQHFGWFYVLSVATFVIVLLTIAVSRYGDIRLGPDDARPEFGFASWLAMLFAAGMGIGLMYFGVGEPMMHYAAPPTAAAGTPAAAREAMTTTFFHWGVHAWAIYALVGLVLAYFGFRYKLPLTLRAGLYPIIKERIHGPIGHAVDVFALVGTIFGIATTLGYGVLQLSAGLNRLTGWDTGSDAFRFGLIAVVIGLAAISAISGLDKGVRRLSELNLLLAVLLLGFVLFAGPTLPLLGLLSENIGQYVSGLVSLTFRTFSYEAASSEGWFGGWTILYWAWWISWSPFVGLFIARISRGRTIREFIVGVLLVPSAFNLLWMTIFGNTAIWLDQNVAGGALAAGAGNVDALLFQFFDYLPLAGVTSTLAVLLIGVFFVTSADSGAFVIDTIATQGAARSPLWQRLFWAVVLGLTAGILMSAGGLKALQSMTLIAALPFAFIMLLLCAGLWRGLLADHLHFSRELSPATNFWNGQLWKARLDQLLRQPERGEVAHFLQTVVAPALAEVSTELNRRGLASRVDTGEEHLALVVTVEGRRDFVYGVRIAASPAPAFNPLAAAQSDAGEEQLFAPQTFFEDGRAGYDVQYLTRQEVIADVLRQYERYLQLLQTDGTALLNAAPGHTS
ncbi:BCCT family transporter [Chitinilyticum litopenaei]|uniref:BCCT family transporter n=1 Tax=Chitinilyticum litopenaei TaxID=1121276 RepID=UPI001B7FA37F|nr:BCCT family transporter [Chitinilyticum litopenaei]